MSAKPARNKETHYNRTEQQSGTGGNEGSGRKRKALSSEREKDKSKRSYKERTANPDQSERRSFSGNTERPARKRTDYPDRGEGRPAGRSYDDRPERRPRGEGPERPARKRTDYPDAAEGRGGKRSFADRENPKRPARREERDGAEERRPRTRPSDSGDRKPYARGGAGDDKRRTRPEGDRPFRKEGDRPFRKESGDRPFRKEGDRPFKKYVPFEDRKDKRTHPEDMDRPRGARGSRDGKPYEQRGADKKAAKPKPKNPFEGEDFYEDERPFTRSTKWDEKAKAGPMTLNKYLAHSGISSRRTAADIIKAGKVKVNGEVMTEPGYRVQEGDRITCDDKEMKPQKHHVYILLNKPKDYITTTDDEKGRRKVMDLVANAGVDRLYPVGRLDRNTTGVLLITNDGDLAQKLSHPSYSAKKIYQVTLDRNLTKKDFEHIIAGVKLEDGVAPVDALAYLEKKNELGIEIHSGRNRIVRRIFEGLGYKVEKLDRVVYAGLTKKNVSRGKWRFLTEKEIIRLKHFKS